MKETSQLKFKKKQITVDYLIQCIGNRYNVLKG